MRKLFLALALCLASSASWAQCNGIFPANTLCGNLSGSPAPPAAFSSGGTVVGPGVTTSGAIVTWGNNTGTLVTNATSITTSQSITWPASQFFSGVTSQSNASITSAAITSTFVYNGFTITFPQSGSAAITSASQNFSGNNTFSGTTSFTGPFVATSTVSLTTPLSIAFGGTGRTSFPIVPTTQSFTTGTSLTYVTPTTNPSPSYLIVEMCAAGGGGGAQATNAGSPGTYTAFGGAAANGWSVLGGAAGSAGSSTGGTGGTGGTNGTGQLIARLSGGAGGSSTNQTVGPGGISLFGAGGAFAGSGATGGSAPANSCGGGAGGGTQGAAFGSSGGAGEYVRFQITVPATGYTYTVAPSTAGGPAGTQAGGNGGGGRIIVREFYE